ncbi:low temperature requirement protein A [Rhizobium mongolense]|uniref:low temperature requirement protein A n=1 Tax=Rhizobium mongolense TaxID=57676 RepID=UPI00355880B7
MGAFSFAVVPRLDKQQASFLTFLRITLWMLVSSVFWIAGALEVRTALWSLALLIEYASPAVRYFVPGMGKSARETLDVSGEHMAERCALFVIICLGETILTTGRNAAEHMAGDLTFAVFCSAFLSTGFMWWIYFHHGQEKAAGKAEATSKPESVALNLFTYGHLPIVAGIILAAVGQDFSLSHASEESTLKNALAILGGPALFLVGNIWVKLAAAREMPVSHIVGLVLLVMVALLLPITVNYHIQMFATAVLFVVALWEYLALRRIAPSSA